MPTKLVSLFYRRDESTTRGNWCGRLDFLAVQLGYMIGFTSVWRMPYMYYRNGGGAFFLVYCLMALLMGIPLVYLESSWGQFAGVGAISMWNVVPICKGIGYATVLVAFTLSCYYAAFCCWSLVYFFRGFSAALLGEMVSCSNYWNSEHCFNGIDEYGLENGTFEFDHAKDSPVEEFFRYRVRDFGTRVTYLDGIEPASAGCLIATWILVFLAVGFGARAFGKVAFCVTGLLYLFGFVFFIRALTLPGSDVGGQYLFLPDWSYITRYTVWIDALNSAFITIGVGHGVLPTLASFNHFTDHSNAESVFTPAVVFVSQLILGRIVFGFIGFLCFTKDVSVDQVMTGGPALVFVTMFEALSHLPGSQGWIILFFLSIFLLGFSTQMCLTFTVVTAFVDEFPIFRLNRRVRHLIMTAVVCVVCFLLGLLFISNGYNCLGLVDNHILIMMPLWVIASCLIISWVYGFPRFFTDVQLMHGYKPFAIWKAFWGILAPFGVFLLWWHYWRNNIELNALYSSMLTEAIGTILYLLTLAPVFVYAVFYMMRYNPTDVIKGPAPSWGPQVPRHRERYQATLSGEQPPSLDQPIEKVTPV